MEDWEKQIRNSTDAQWKADRFIRNLKEHRLKYPGFIAERAAEYFSNNEYKVQGALAYADIAELNQQLRKSGYRTESEREAAAAVDQWHNDMLRDHYLNFPKHDPIKDPYGG